MEPTQKITDSKAVIALLAELFPKCFSVTGATKPLKIGIFQELAERLADDERVSKTTLRSTLRHYTNSWRYLECIVAGAKRVDLDGQEGEEINAEHAEFAQKQLAESKAKAAEKRAQAPKKPNKNFKKPAFKAKVNHKSSPAQKRPPAPKLNDDQLVVGTAVTVKLGKAPMAAKITAVEKDGVAVQLDSGMAVKVQAHQLRLDTRRR
jgi:ProP effector